MINLNSLTKNIKDGFKAPTGDSNRETPTKGALRFNTETGKPEIYAKGRGWRRASVSEISAIYTHDNLVAFYDASNADTTGDTSDQYYSDVELLLHMNGTDGSTTFTDSSSSNRSASNSGVSIETEQFKFGGSSAYFDGNDVLTYSSFPNFGANNFTIECWFYRTSTGHLASKSDESGPNSNLGWRLNIRSDNAKIDFRGSSNGIYPSDSAVLLQSTTNTVTNTWYHVAVTWDGSTYRMFVNGVLEVSQASSTSIYNSSRSLKLGSSYNNGSNIGQFTGYIDEFRITIGTARYTADFTPQTREFYPGTAVSDITSNNNSGFNVGSTTLNSSGGISTYGPFNLSQYINIPFKTQQQVSNITAGGWFYSNNWSNADGALFSNFQLGGFGITADRNGNGKLEARIITSVSPETIQSVNVNLSTISSGWHQIYITVDNSSFKLYIDANEVNAQSINNGIMYGGIISLFPHELQYKLILGN